MPRDRREPEKINYLAPVLIGISIIAALFVWYMIQKPARPPAPAEAPSVTAEEPAIGKIEEPQIKYPVPEPPPAEPAAPEVPVEPAAEVPAPPAAPPAVTVEDEFTTLFDWQQYGDLFLLKTLINHFVVTVDNLTGPKLPQKFAFTRPPAGKFAVQKGADQSDYIDPANYQRYSKFVQFAQAADVSRFVAFYVKHYALFQLAYEDLGYPGRYFNDRLVDVIEHVLQAPDVRGPIKLVRPKVYYNFADPELEALSAGQKILIRIGPDHAAVVKAKLQELRQALTSLKRQ